MQQLKETRSRLLQEYFNRLEFILFGGTYIIMPNGEKIYRNKQ
jgi:hypothetical protein